MKGTFDYGQKYAVKLDGYPYIDYSNVDGLTIKTVMRMFNAHIIKLIGINEIKMKDNSCIWDSFTIVSESEIPEEDESIDYFFASRMIETYHNLNNRQDVHIKKAILAFLERYIVDYKDVRSFVRNGYNISMSPEFGASENETLKLKKYL